MTLEHTAKADVAEYLSATRAQEALYAEIGTDEVKARLHRNDRWAANRRRREAAENLIMAMLGLHKPRLAAAGLVEFYESIAAGKESDSTLYRIADETAKFLA
jgi:hypothetical protein